MEWLITIARLGYEIRTVIVVQDDALSEEAILRMAKEKFTMLGVELFDDDSFDVELL